MLRCLQVLYYTEHIYEIKLNVKNAYFLKLKNRTEVHLTKGRSSGKANHRIPRSHSTTRQMERPICREANSKANNTYKNSDADVK